jgi:hypothetical protein
VTRALLALVVALVAAPQALAAYSPKLAVQQSGAGTTIRLTIPSTDDTSAQLSFFAPAGARADLSATPGTTIGTLTAKASLDGAAVALTGTVEARAADPAAPPDCTGATTHAAYWALLLRTGLQTVELPLFVDPTPDSEPAVSFSLTVCLPPFGAKLFELELTIDGVFSAPSAGDNLWRVLATPYSPQAVPVEAQSFVEAATITLPTPRRTLTPTAATFSAAGAVEIGGLSDTSATVAIARGATAARLAVVARPRLSAGDRYSTRFSIQRTRRAQVLYLQAAATAPTRDLAATACKPTFGVPCIAATAGGFTAKSPQRKVVVPRRPR